jgi:hypothetical protein
MARRGLGDSRGGPSRPGMGRRARRGLGDSRGGTEARDPPSKQLFSPYLHTRALALSLAFCICLSCSLHAAIVINCMCLCIVFRYPRVQSRLDDLAIDDGPWTPTCSSGFLGRLETLTWVEEGLSGCSGFWRVWWTATLPAPHGSG